jgi:sarcosine oxidase, subunit alpha
LTRLPAQPGERIDRARSVSFEFDGRPVQAFEGDTIGSALFASGQRTFSRSFKYHRRRGLLCCAGQCPNCLVAVDGAPGVRACTEPAREGMRVEHMNASPSLELDLMSVTDRVGSRLTPPGFYYKTFIRPRRLWPLYEKVLRNAAGLGRLPRAARVERDWRTEYRRRHADVLVVGGGEAGLRAALAAAEAGEDTVLADEGPEPGGWMLVDGRVAEARELAERARAAGVEILSNAPALGFFDGLVPVWQGSTLHQIRARRHVFATGSIEQPLLFEGNDLPGVMLSSGARRLASLYAVRPGTEAVVVTGNDRGIEAAEALRQIGVDIRAIADLREGWTVVKAKGKRTVTGVVLANGDEKQTIDCDLLVVSGGFAPANSLIRQAGENVEAVGEVTSCGL